MIKENDQLNHILNKINMTTNLSESVISNGNKELASIELFSGYKLPSIYKYFFYNLSLNPLKNITFSYIVEDKYNVFRAQSIRFFMKSNEKSGILYQYKYIQNLLKDEFNPKNMIPIGFMDDTYIIYLDYSLNSKTPTVSMMSHYEKIYLADSFEDFIDNINDYNLFHIESILSNIRNLKAMKPFINIDQKINKKYQILSSLQNKLITSESTKILMDCSAYTGESLEESTNRIFANIIKDEHDIRTKTWEDLSPKSKNNKIVLNQSFIWTKNALKNKIKYELPNSFLNFIENSQYRDFKENKFAFYDENKLSFLKFNFFEISGVIPNETPTQYSELLNSNKAFVKYFVDKYSTQNAPIKMTDSILPFAFVNDRTVNGFLGILISDTSESIVFIYNKDKNKELNNLNSKWEIQPLADSFDEFINNLITTHNLNKLRKKQVQRINNSYYSESFVKKIKNMLA